MTTAILEAIATAKTAYDAAVSAASESLRENFAEVFGTFLADHPQVENIQFTAYTPYFADGEECIFGVNEPWFEFKGVEIEAYDVPDIVDIEELIAFKQTGAVGVDQQTDFDRYYHRSWPSVEALAQSRLDVYGDCDLPALLAALKAWPEAARSFGSLPGDVIRDMFGDHVKVTVSRDGTEADSYDHD